jgi:hypothetical protein
MASPIPLFSNPAHISTHDVPSPPPFNTSKYHFYRGHILQERSNSDANMGRLKLMKIHWELVLREFSTSPHRAWLTVYHEAVNSEQKDFKKNEIDAINRLIKKDSAARTNAEISRVPR